MASLLSSSKVIAFIGTRDRVRAQAFYAETLGLRLVSDDPFALVFDAGGTMLRVTPVPEMTAAGYTVLGWNVPDVAATVAELSARGVEFRRFAGLEQDAAGIWTAPGGTPVAWFQDPDGNLLSLSRH